MVFFVGMECFYDIFERGAMSQTPVRPYAVPQPSGTR